MVTLGWREKKNEIYERQITEVYPEIDSIYDTDDQSSDKKEIYQLSRTNNNKRPNYTWAFWAWATVSVWVIIIPFVELTSNR